MVIFKYQDEIINDGNHYIENFAFGPVLGGRWHLEPLSNRNIDPHTLVNLDYYT